MQASRQRERATLAFNLALATVELLHEEGIPIVSLLLVLLVPVFCRGADWMNFRADANRMEKRIQELSASEQTRRGGESLCVQRCTLRVVNT